MHPKGLERFNAAFSPPEIAALTKSRTAQVKVSAQVLGKRSATLSCRVAIPNDWCQRCVILRALRGMITHRLAYVNFGLRPTVLLISVRHYRLAECGFVGSTR